MHFAIRIYIIHKTIYVNKLEIITRYTKYRWRINNCVHVIQSVKLKLFTFNSTRVSDLQRKLFLNFVKENPSIAQADKKNNKKKLELWEQISKTLNASGPCTRSTYGWKSVLI